MGDRDVAKLPTRERLLGVVFQSYELFPHLTAEENLLFAARARKRKDLEARAHSARAFANVGARHVPAGVQRRFFQAAKNSALPWPVH